MCGLAWVPVLESVFNESPFERRTRREGIKYGKMPAGTNKREQKIESGEQVKQTSFAVVVSASLSGGALVERVKSSLLAGGDPSSWLPQSALKVK